MATEVVVNRVVNGVIDKGKVKKARAPRHTHKSRIVLDVSVPTRYLVTLRSTGALSDAQINALVSKGHTLHDVIVACKAVNVAAMFESLGEGDGANVWHRAKVVVE